MMAQRKASTTRKYWLFKSEPAAFSIDHLAAGPKQTTFWSGVRNYQARNMLRDDVQVGDKVLFYHSNADPLAIVGVCEIVRAGYPDHTAFEVTDQHYDEHSDPENPTWYMVDLRLLQKFHAPVTRDQIKATPALQKMELMRKGSRLSIQPVTADEYAAVLKLAGMKAT